MEIHAHRKREQTEAGLKLKDLERNWVTMVTNNYRYNFHLFKNVYCRHLEWSLPTIKWKKQM